MPFATHCGEVTGGTKDFGNRDAAIVEPPAITGNTVIFRHVADAGLMRVKTGEDGGPGRATAAGVIELCETQTLSGQSIEVRSWDFASVTTKIRKTHVIDENEKDVWPGGAGSLSS